jgi:hypothetical protein
MAKLGKKSIAELVDRKGNGMNALSWMGKCAIVRARSIDLLSALYAHLLFPLGRGKQVEKPL